MRDGREAIAASSRPATLKWRDRLGLAVAGMARASAKCPYTGRMQPCPNKHENFVQRWAHECANDLRRGDWDATLTVLRRLAQMRAVHIA